MKYNNDKSALFKWVEYIFLVFYALKFIVPYAVQLTTVFTFMNVTDLLWFIALGWFSGCCWKSQERFTTENRTA